MLNELIYNQPLVLFLGAGASAPLGMKTTVEFIDWIKYLEGIDFSLITKVINNVRPSDEIGKRVDIEAVLDYLEDIISVKQHYTNLALLYETSKLDAIIKLRDKIEDLVITHYCEIDANKAFNHYEPLLRELPTSTLPIFTTNYDLSIEKAYESSKKRFRLRMIDGFERTTATIPHWSETAYKDYKPRKKGNDIILFKLHGSVDWHRTPGGEIQRIEARQRNPGSLKTVVVYPSRTKKEIHEEPFRTNYDYLLACLVHAKLCFVIGFSFRDREIVEHFREAAGINKDLHVAVLDLNKEIAGCILNKCDLSTRFAFSEITEAHIKENIKFAAQIMKAVMKDLLNV